MTSCVHSLQTVTAEIFVYKIPKDKFKCMNFRSGNSWSCFFSK